MASTAIIKLHRSSSVLLTIADYVLQPQSAGSTVSVPDQVPNDFGIGIDTSQLLVSGRHASVERCRQNNFVLLEGVIDTLAILGGIRVHHDCSQLVFEKIAVESYRDS